ncbi:GMC oxidoreductase [Gaopeijia maritima]|uniref:GMC oxidoreductase n=1 Tax=Gaopeijia maritima TaxID=3119007 RepID=A0ABU9ED71_9BACT
MVTPSGVPEETAVCVVGAGPVGLALAAALVDRGVPVVVLEGGDARGARPATERDDALAGTVSPGGLGALTLTRARGVGGTSRIWNTEVGGEPVAKLLALDPIDYEARPGLPHGGWPIDADAMAPWVREAAAWCGLDLRLHDTVSEGPDPLERGAYGFVPQRRFLHELPEAVAAAGATVRAGVTTTGLLLEGARVTGVRWRNATGARGTLRAGTTVLACGTLETTRVLLEAAGAGPTPWGDNPWLGRGLMEHPIDRSLVLRTRSPLLTPDPGFFSPHRAVVTRGGPPGPWRLGRLTLPADWLRAHRLPNLSVRFPTHEAGGAILQQPTARSWARRLVPGARLRRAIGDAVRWGARQTRRLQSLEYTLHIDLEQWPDRANRVELAEATDALGRRRLAVHWRWSDDDERRRQALLDELTDRLHAAGLGSVTRSAGVSLDPDGHHHAGTTRMHIDPEGGVVDADLKVHGAEGLHLCGASVFPTAGVANPTLVAMALARRLAATLAADRP